TVTIEGVVVGDFQGGGEQLSGFFLQSTAPDGDPSTSEGLFVYDGSSPELDVELGDRVRVRGAVSEYNGLTELTPTAVQSCGAGVLPAPTELPFPHDGGAQLEALEGMLVRTSGLAVTETYNLGRYGEVSLSAGGRLMH